MLFDNVDKLKLETHLEISFLHPLCIVSLYFKVSRQPMALFMGWLVPQKSGDIFKFRRVRRVKITQGKVFLFFASKRIIKT